MTYDRDYVLRMVKQFSDFLARIVRTRDTAPDGRTHAELDGLARSFVGLNLEALDALPPDQLVMMLSLGGTLDVNRSYAAGRLLEERSETAWAAGRPAAASAAAVKAMHLFATSALAFGGYLNEEHAAAMERTVRRTLERDADALRAAPDLLCDVLEVHVQEGEAGAIRHVARVLQEAEPEADDPLTALRIALRGRCAMLLGRLEPVLTGDGDATGTT